MASALLSRGAMLGHGVAASAYPKKLTIHSAIMLPKSGIVLSFAKLPSGRIVAVGRRFAGGAA